MFKFVLFFFKKRSLLNTKLYSNKRFDLFILNNKNYDHELFYN